MSDGKVPFSLPRAFMAGMGAKAFHQLRKDAASKRPCRTCYARKGEACRATTNINGERIVDVATHQSRYIPDAARIFIDAIMEATGI